MDSASDPREADVAYTEQLLDRLAESGRIAKLPTMNTTELCALGALTWPLLDEHALRWWDAQPDREEAARRGYDHMVRRNMIDPASGRVHPQLGIIIAARSRPAFVVILRDHPDSADALPSRFLGIMDESAGLRAVLMETVPPIVTRINEHIGPLHVYELSAPGKCARTIADFASRGERLVIDVYRPGSETSLPSHRFTVTRNPRKLRVEWRTPYTSPQQWAYSPDELAGLLLDTMAGACQ